MAKVAAAMAAGGRLGETVLLSDEAWREMHSEPKKARDLAVDVNGMSPSSFTKGGVNEFR